MKDDKPLTCRCLEIFLCVCSQDNSKIVDENLVKFVGNIGRPVTRSFDVFFDLHMNKRLSKQS